MEGVSTCMGGSPMDYVRTALRQDVICTAVPWVVVTVKGSSGATLPATIPT